MNRPTTPVAGYREQIARLARALAAARDDEVRDALAAGSSPAELRMFVDDNVDKRLDKLRRQLESVAPAFEDFEERLNEFHRSVPLAAYATTDTDADRLLAWLEREGGLTLEQRDHVACQRARHAVEAKARRKRVAYVRFQELASTAASLADDLGVNPGLRIHLNPIRARAKFVTPALLDEDAKPPADVMFFAHAGEISAAILDRRAKRLARELARLSPTTLDEWLYNGTRADSDELIAWCCDLAGMGLVAFS